MSRIHRFCHPLLLGALMFCTGGTSDAASDAGGAYETLSAEAKQRFRDNYENLPDADEPPYPLEGMQSIGSQIGYLNQRILGVGTLIATVLIDEKGKPHSVDFYSLPVSDVAVTQAEQRKTYAAVLMGTAYKPAVCGGKPCVMEFFFKAEFSKERRSSKNSRD